MEVHLFELQIYKYYVIIFYFIFYFLIQTFSSLQSANFTLDPSQPWSVFTGVGLLQYLRFIWKPLDFCKQPELHLPSTHLLHPPGTTLTGFLGLFFTHSPP